MAKHLLSLADDILIELLGILSPSDAISCRKVCRRLHRLSLERSVWLKIRSNCDYTLPEISESLEVAELERILLRGEIMKDKWTGVQKGAPHTIFQGNVGRSNATYLGMMGPYVVMKFVPGAPETSKQLRLVWSPPDKLFNHVFACQIGRYSKCIRTITHSFTNANSMRIAYIGISEEDNEARYRLEVICVKLECNSVPGASLEVSVPIPDAMAKNVTLSIQHDYALISQAESTLTSFSHDGTNYTLISPAEPNPVALVHIPTAKMVPMSSRNSQLSGWVNNLISPWHLIGVSHQGDVHFYSLPSPEDLSDKHVRRTHEILLPVRGSIGLQSFPRSPTRYTVIGVVGNTLVNWDVRLPPVQGEIPTLAEVHASCSTRISLDEGHRIRDPTYYDVPPSSKTVLGILLVEKGRLRRCEYDFIAFRAELDRTETSREPIITMVKLENMVGPNYCGWLRLLSFDPFNGVVLLRYEDVSTPNSAAYGQRLRVLQYLPAQLIT